MTRPNDRRATAASALRTRLELSKRPRERAFGSWYTQPHQDALWRYLENGGTRACCVWHRRAGKDDIALKWACKAGHRRPGVYWHMLPQAEQARKAIWSAINPHTGKRRIDESFPVGMRRRTRENEMMIELDCGSIWQVVGSDNYNALVGSPPVGVVFSEWSLADPAAWAYISPILRENGGWALFLYTPRGRNHGLSTLNVAKASADWFWQVLDATQTDVFTPAELAQELREKRIEFGPDLGQAFFDQEYMCSFDAANLGAVYAAWIRHLERKGKVGAMPPVPGYPINTGWDLGFSDKTAIWFWQMLPGPEVRFVDYYSNSGQGPQHYAEVLHGRRIDSDPRGHIVLGDRLPGHEHRIGWEYGKHYAPHDAAHHVLAANGRSFGDTMYAMGFSLDVLDQVNQMDQITGARRVLEWSSFDKERCEQGLQALESYHYAWDEKARVLKPEPTHDWSSHGSDALEIVAQAVNMPLPKKAPEAPRFLHEATANEIFWPKNPQGQVRRLERL